MNYIDKIKSENPIIFKILFNTINKNKLAHAVIFSAQRGTPTHNESYFLAQALINEDPFSQSAVRNIETYPDFHTINGKESLIKKNQIIEVITKLKETPLEKNGKKILLINNIENSNKESFNSLLKFLEEPTKDTYIIMTTNNISKVLATIKSRSQIINLKAKSSKEINEVLKKNNINEKYSKILSSFVDSAQHGIKEVENLKIVYEKILEALVFGISDKNQTFFCINKLIDKNNYWIVANTLRVFFNDIWRDDLGIELFFNEEKLVEKYRLMKFDYSNAILTIDDFLRSKSYNANFNLSKNEFMIKIMRCYE